MGLSLEYINGQTPIDEEEKGELLIPTIVNRGELDEFEQKNIEEAFREQNLVLMNYINMMALFSEAKNIEGILEMLIQYIKNN